MEAKYNVVECLEALGVKRISERGDEVTFSCPQDFHARGDKNPSASINKKNYAYHCFSCGASGTLYSLVGDVLGVSPAISIRWLREKFWLGGELEQRSIKLTLQNMLNPKDDPDQLPKWLDESVLNNFRVNWDKAWSYYNSEGLTKALSRPFEHYGLDLKTVKQFELGYHKDSNRITIPIRDIDGKLIRIKGRSSDNNDYPKYLTLGDTEGKNKFGFPRLKDEGLVFGLDSATPDLVICEGEFDAMSLRQKGFTGAVAIGTCETSEKQLVNIKKKAERATILFDPDEPGREGARKLADLLYPTLPVTIGELDESDPAETSKKDIQRIIKNAKTPLELRHKGE